LGRAGGDILARRFRAMKFLPSQLAYLTTDREARANLRALSRFGKG
jgi:hypothetical protein